MLNSLFFFAIEIQTQKSTFEAPAIVYILEQKQGLANVEKMRCSLIRA